MEALVNDCDNDDAGEEDRTTCFPWAVANSVAGFVLPKIWMTTRTFVALILNVSLYEFAHVCICANIVYRADFQCVKHEVVARISFLPHDKGHVKTSEDEVALVILIARVPYTKMHVWFPRDIGFMAWRISRMRDHRHNLYSLVALPSWEVASSSCTTTHFSMK